MSDIKFLYRNNIEKALDGSTDGVIINGKCINNLRYADNTVIMSNSEEGLKRLINRVVSICPKTQYKLHKNNGDQRNPKY